MYSMMEQLQIHAAYVLGFFFQQSMFRHNTKAILGINVKVKEILEKKLCILNIFLLKHFLEDTKMCVDTYIIRKIFFEHKFLLKDLRQNIILR